MNGLLRFVCEVPVAFVDELRVGLLQDYLSTSLKRDLINKVKLMVVVADYWWAACPARLIDCLPWVQGAMGPLDLLEQIMYTLISQDLSRCSRCSLSRKGWRRCCSSGRSLTPSGGLEWASLLNRCEFQRGGQGCRGLEGRMKEWVKRGGGGRGSCSGCVTETEMEVILIDAITLCELCSDSGSRRT